ncbi:hypothetical protein Tco_1015418 [Tanacetum coccineum]|uniref:Uncharacterized protein n=1 Tax=Tanacetum coccineum TaxID=301880 RepID=A0ABQ5FLV5_9ASTR
MEELLNKFMAESTKRHEENSYLIKQIRASTDAAIRKQRASIKDLEIQIGKMSKVLQQRGTGNLPSLTETNLRDHVKSISTTIETDTTLIRYIGPSRYAVSGLQNSKLFFVPSQVTIPFPSCLYDDYFDEEEGSYELKDLDAYSIRTTLLDDALPTKEKDLGSFTLPCISNNLCFNKALADLGNSVSVITFLPGGGEVVDEPMMDIVKTRCDNKIIAGLDEYPSYCEFDRKTHIDHAYNLQFSCMIGYEHVNADFFPLLSINVMSKSFYNSIVKDKVEYQGRNVVGAFMDVPIFVGNFFVVTDFAVIENINSYQDKGMGDIIIGRPFCKDACIKARWFDGMITIYKENDSVTYQMARSHPRFKHLTNAQCNKMRPLLKVSAQDELKGISHPYQKLKGFYKEVLNLGPEYIKDEKVVKWLTLGHVSVHEME